MTRHPAVAGADESVADCATPTDPSAVVGGSTKDALARLGIGAVPAPLSIELPHALPALPTLPSLDPTMLVKPITDLLQTFGSGRLGGAGGDPAVAHQGIADVLGDGVGTILGAVRSLDGGWAGQAATAAVSAATRSAGESGLLAAQGAGISTDLQAAAAVVAAGAAQLQGIVVKTAGLLAAAGPALATPPGQIAALGIAAEGLAEGLAVVAATRAQLIAPTTHMAANGQLVPVTGVPGAEGDLFSVAGRLLQSALPLVQAGTGLATKLLSGTGLDGSRATQVEEPTGPPEKPVPGSTGTPCPAACDRTGTASAPTSAAHAPGSAPSAPTARASTTAATVAATPSVSAPEPMPLADRPTTNAAMPTSADTVRATPVAAANPVSAVPQAQAPVVPASARPSNEAPRVVPAVPVAVVPDTSADPEWLSAVTAESIDFDVALALGLGDENLAGSA
ncbi:hypothetical protein [Gordonia neofelifaecis]|uniref:Uncharacterized protein n=1 Tax=Gordonia neofelifaecis NRRL B-59395 TaxID=644548 RepID=F1YJF7_9ACTN|nr:hypothetical protein [Gordonia neofelifaecis]EGD55190.1 hypothetical protein SCNU_09969 [Gordonia neofelifaecis NRRL B-59395]